MESWHSAPLPGYEAIAAAGMTKVNTYYNIRLADIVGADPTVHHDNVEVDTRTSSVPGPDDHKADNTYRYDTAVEPPALATVTTMNKDIPATRTLKDWIDDIHGRGGDALRGRQLADSPISHYNSWVRVPTPSTADRGRVSTPEALMETWDEFGRPDVAQPRSNTTTSVFDGGGRQHPRDTGRLCV